MFSQSDKSVNFDFKLIAIGLIIGVSLGLMALGAIRWLPKILETPLRAEFALQQPNKPTTADDIEIANKALELVQAGQFDDAIAMVREPALLGSPWAQGVVGNLYYSGAGVKQDIPESMRWYRLSADQGNPASQFALAMGYATGRGVQKNLKESHRLTEAAANGSFPLAQYVLGAAMLFGNGSDSDQSRGWNWLKIAASQGEANAQELVEKMKIRRPAAQVPLAEDVLDTWIASRLQEGVTLYEMQILSEIMSRDRLGNGSYGTVESDRRSYSEPNSSLPQISNSRDHSTQRTANSDLRSSELDEYRFRGMSGANYKYDLSSAYGRLQYEIDPMAQLQDSISVDPRKGLDESMGQYGGGIKP